MLFRLVVLLCGLVCASALPASLWYAMLYTVPGSAEAWVTVYTGIAGGCIGPFLVSYYNSLASHHALSVAFPTR